MMTCSYVEGEKTAKTIADLIKQPWVTGDIAAVTNRDGQICHVAEEITQAVAILHTDLHSSRRQASEMQLTEYPTEMTIAWQSDGYREFLEQPITVKEIIESNKELPSGNAPDNDWLSAEFDKAFESLLAPDLLEVFKEVMDRRLLPPAVREVLPSQS
ncbi:hypothetical protein NDU88_001804 [Pleurodeles waltl]|uniref:Uncharacterized protein n=1 Tax=Pleurodeles waltl TaxID=8319 RepID=A0AAV7M0K6_PLEWA|nr:hypothetical protein NDU88_001804 [Pleurodeles waltl]